MKPSLAILRGSGCIFSRSALLCSAPASQFSMASRVSCRHQAMSHGGRLLCSRLSIVPRLFYTRGQAESTFVPFRGVWVWVYTWVFGESPSTTSTQAAGLHHPLPRVGPPD